MTDEKSVRIKFSITPDQQRDIRIAAAKQNKNITSFVRDLVLSSTSPPDEIKTKELEG